MKEDFLHHTWKYRLFDQRELRTSRGEAVEIFKPGDHNTDAGPDFFNSRIKVDGQLWAGNVEIHVNSSDWIKHDHQNDEAYNNVLLHVVFENDAAIKRKNGDVIPTLELKNKIDKTSYQKYLQLNTSKDRIPCGEQIAGVDPFILNNWLDSVLIERLETKAALILDRLEKNKNNWEETFYHILARNFGFKTNNEPFELLAHSLPLNVISKHKNDRFQIEALLYGQAGMLGRKFAEEYPLNLQKEYNYLKQKFSLQPMDAHLWKFSRMMPGNFPSIRISQFARLIQSSSHLFSKILEAENVEALKKLFISNASRYWQDHYVFEKRSSPKMKSLGADSIDILIINAVVPFLFIYGKKKGEERFIDRALNILENIEGEKNGIIANWIKLGVKAGTSYRSQALLQLKKEYCEKKKCLHCAVGVKLLSR